MNVKISMKPENIIYKSYLSYVKTAYLISNASRHDWLIESEGES